MKKETKLETGKREREREREKGDQQRKGLKEGVIDRQKESLNGNQTGGRTDIQTYR